MRECMLHALLAVRVDATVRELVAEHEDCAVHNSMRAVSDNCPAPGRWHGTWDTCKMVRRTVVDADAEDDEDGDQIKNAEVLFAHHI